MAPQAPAPFECYLLEGALRLFMRGCAAPNVTMTKPDVSTEQRIHHAREAEPEIGAASFESAEDAIQPGLSGTMLPGAVSSAEPRVADGVPPGYKWRVLAVVGSGVYMVTLDSGIVNVALPVLTQDFGASLTLVEWVILAYVLCITGLLLPAGRLADMLGRREVFLAGFIIFGGASALCGMAPNVSLLIAARVVQGIGGALMQANMAALLTQAFPASERGRALGLNSSIVSAGLLSGPVIGGLITEHFGWRAAFYINVPISIIAMLVGWRLLRPSPRQPGRRFDIVGTVLFIVAAAALLLGLNQGQEWGWESLATIAAFALAIVGTLGFLWVQQHTAQPTIRLTMFENRGFSVASVCAFLSFLAIAPVTLLMPFYLELVLRLPVGQAGLVLTAIPATVAVLAPVSGALSDTLGTRLISSVGLAVETVGLLSLALLPLQTSIVWIVVRLAVVGIGLALFQSPNSSALFGSVPRSELGLVGGFQALTRNLGQSIGQAVAGAVWTAMTLAAAVGVAAAVDAPPEAMLPGFRVIYFAGVALAAFSTLISFVLRPRREQAPLDEEEPVEAEAAERREEVLAAATEA